MNKAVMFTLVLFVMGATGCASHRYTVVAPPTKPLTDYSILEIPEFDTYLNDAFIDYMQQYMSS